MMVAVNAANITSGSSALEKEANQIFNTATSIHFAPSVVALISIVAGTFVTFLGYRLIRPVLFVAGFAVGSVSAYALVHYLFNDYSYVETASWIGFAVGGLFVAFLVVWLYYLGIFAVGAVAGVLLACAFNNSFGYEIWPSDPTKALYIMAAVLGVLFGLLALWIERPFLIFATSLFGAISTVWGIGYFAGKYPNSADLTYWREQIGSNDWQYNIPHAWWGYLAGTIVLFLVGMYIQFNVTARDVQHTHANSSSRPGNHAVPYENCTTPVHNSYYGNSAPRQGNPITYV